MRIRALVAAVAIVVALAATACSGSGSEGADDATTTSEATTTTIAVEVPDDAVATDQITITDEGFDPPVVVVEAGATVGWSNQGTSPHTATAEEGAFDTGAIGPGDALAITVDEPGIHTYRCDLHPDLTATLVVTP